MKYSPFLLSSLMTVSLIFTACGGSGGSDDDEGDDTPEQVVVIDENYPPSPYTGWYQPDTATTWQWQLSGDVNTSYNVDLYDIDLFDNNDTFIAQLKASGKKVICYFSAGSYEAWREDNESFQPEDLGNTLDGWADERWLDVRSANVRTIMQSRLDLAAAKGCDGVEPDNMDGYLRDNDSGFDFTAQDQLDYNRFIANEAHDRNLSVALKNDVDQLGALVEYYDFAVNEECFFYNECSNYALFTERNKAVFNAEYTVSNKAALCTKANTLLIKTLILPLELDDSSRDSCQDEL